MTPNTSRRRALPALALCSLCAIAGLGRADSLAPPPAAKLSSLGSPSARELTHRAIDPQLRTQLGAELAGAGVITGATTRRIVHFTFDDGPDPVHTPALLDVLDRAGMKATFFFSTSRFASKENRNAQAAALAREVQRRGHPLGSHSFNHQRMAKLAPAALADELAKSDAAFERIFGARTHLFRPPFGSRNAALDTMLAERRDATVMWNLGMADWVKREPEAIKTTFFRVLARNEAERGERGGVVLMHDTHPWSVRGFELIVAELHRKNCELLAAREELYDLAESLAPFAAPPDDASLAARQAELREREQARCARIGAGR